MKTKPRSAIVDKLFKGPGVGLHSAQIHLPKHQLVILQRIIVKLGPFGGSIEN
jgi:hypothetical protein